MLLQCKQVDNHAKNISGYKRIESISYKLYTESNRVSVPPVGNFFFGPVSLCLPSGEPSLSHFLSCSADAASLSHCAHPESRQGPRLYLGAYVPCFASVEWSTVTQLNSQPDLLRCAGAWRVRQRCVVALHVCAFVVKRRKLSCLRVVAES